VAHEALSRLAKERAAAEAEEGRWLLAALRSATHVHLGYGSFGEYVERLFGHKPRSTQERLRVAEALEQLPALSQELEQGDQVLSKLCRLEPFERLDAVGDDTFPARKKPAASDVQAEDGDSTKAMARTSTA